MSKKKYLYPADSPLSLSFQRSIYGFLRAYSLCNLYDRKFKGQKGRKHISATDILRSAVVLAHATLEDCIRTIVLHNLEYLDRQSIDKIPIHNINHSNRPEKFFLGELLEFRGQTVDDVIRLSVESHLARLSFNNTNDIVRIFKIFKIDCPKDDKIFNLLDEMIQRRHRIVHYGDRVVSPGRGKQFTESISSSRARVWIENAHRFITSIIVIQMEKVGEVGSIEVHLPGPLPT